MAEQPFRFSDGEIYERGIGTWSRLAGDIFLDWLAPRPGLRWIDVGCGNGAFTELLVERCAPSEILGIDPSEGQLAFARARPAGRVAEFRRGDAMALAVPDDTFDAAVMALVIFFVADPAKGVAEMVRVVCPGGTIAAYAWDMLGGGFPLEPIQDELRRLGVAPPLPPSADASRLEALRELWVNAGLDAVALREITVRRTFADFDDFWNASIAGTSTAPIIAALEPGVSETLKARVRARLPADGSGRITYGARANAIRGRVPA